jgi:hypothetical protein
MEDAASPVIGAHFSPRFVRSGAVATALGVLVCLGTLGAAAPVRADVPGSALGGWGRAPSLDPFRQGSVKPAANPTKTPTTLAQQAPAAEPAPTQPAPAAPARAVGAGCQADDQCPGGTICENGACTPVEPPIHALLYRKEGGATWFIPFYFGKSGNPGHRVVAPLYWHFWSPEERSQIFAPFYWRFEDHVRQRVVTVVPPFSSTREPGASSWALWPIFYKSTKFGWAAPLLGSFKIANPDEQRSYGLYALLYFWKRNERAGTSLDVLVPLFASSRSEKSAWTWVAPLNFYWRTGTGAEQDTNLLLLPLMYWSSNAAKDAGTLVTPVGYHARTGADRSGSLLWLYWFGRKADGRAHDVVVPILWSFRSPTSSTTVLPPFVHLRRPTFGFTTLFPLYWAGSDPQAGTAWRLLLPVFLGRSRDSGRQASWYTPLGGYSRNDDEGTRTLGFWLPPMLFQRDNDRELHMVLGLYWRYNDRRNNASTTLVGPFYRGTDPGGSTTSVFPLFWHFYDAPSGATAHTLFPLYFRRSGPAETMTAAGVFPLWGYYRSFRQAGQDDGWSAGLFPLAFFGSRPQRGHGVIFPLFWHFRDRQGSATVAAPFYLRFANETRTTAVVPPLLYYYARQTHTLPGGGTTEDRTHIQVPFFWRFANGRSGITTTVIPPFYWRSGSEKSPGWSAGLFPLLFASSFGERGHFVLAPLFWHFRDDRAQKKTTVVLNYFHRHLGDETTDAFLPLFYYRRGARPGGSDETSFTLLPFAHYKRTQDRRVLVTLLGASYRSPALKAGVIPPYFWYESQNIAASGVPLLYMDIFRKPTADSEGERTRIIGPWVATDSPSAKARVLFPLFARYNNPREAGTWVFPTYYRRRTTDGYNLDSFVPLFWYSRSSQHQTTVVGPWFRRTGAWEGGDRYSTGFVPLFVYSRNPERRLLVTPLFYNRHDYKNNTGKTFAALLFYRSNSPTGHTTVGFPLYWGGRTGPRSHAVLFPLLWHFADDNAQTSSTLLGPLYWSQRGGGEGGSKARTRGLLPIAWYSRDDEKGTASNAILPLFYEKHGRAGNKLLTVPFGFGKSPQSSFWYALNVVRYESVTSTFTTVFPLYFGHANRATQSSTKLIPPLLYFSSSRPDRSLTGLALLLWRHTNVTSQTNLVLPLFYDVHNYHQNRLTILVPLFLRYWRASDQNAYTLAPLFFRRSGPSDSTTVLFPLLWDFKGKDSRSTVFFPLFARFRRPTYVSTFVLPTIYYRSGIGPAEGTNRLVIFPLWESGAKRRGDTMWEVLLGLFGYERIGRNRYLKLLFFPFSLEPAPAAQTAWYSRPRGPVRDERRRYGTDTRAW